MDNRNASLASLESFTRMVTAPIALGLGVILGVLIGLWIGWGLWPVEWEGAALGDLDPGPKAEYIAAVADTFILYDSPEAAEIALNRLAPLRNNLDEEFVAAIQYFQASTQPERAIRISNIGRLATSLGMVPPDLQVAQPVPNEEPAIPPEGGAAVDEAVGESLESGTDQNAGIAGTVETNAPATISWLRWFLWLLAALLLLGGGLYLLAAAGLLNWQQWFSSRFESKDRRDDEFPTDERYSTSEGSHAHDTADDLAFDEDEAEFDEWHYPQTSSQPAGYTDIAHRHDSGFQSRFDAHDPYDDAQLDNRPFVPKSTTNFRDELTERHDDSPHQRFDYATDSFDESDDDGEAITGHTIDRHELDEAQDVLTVNRLMATPTPPSTTAEPPELNNVRDQEDLDHAALTERLEEQSQEIPSSTVVPAAQSQRSRYQMINQHTLRYQVGIAEYDESKPIVDQASGKYIGEFGMGTSMKNGLVQPDPEHVAALEVWLFDKSDEKNMGNQTRILLSEYAVDHNLEHAFVKERQDNPRPFTAQPNVHFQLESQNLLLDCTITQVNYIPSGQAKGMFHSIAVDMSVHQKI